MKSLLQNNRLSMAVVSLLLGAVGVGWAAPPPAGTILTIAGKGTSFGDGGQAVLSRLFSPGGVAVDGAGDTFIADTGNNRLRKVDSHGVITTVAGTGTPGVLGNFGPALSAQLSFPIGVAVDGAGNLYIAEYTNNWIRKIDTTGKISTVVGTGTMGFSGDGQTAILAQLNAPTSVAVDGSGDLFIADTGNNRIRKVTPQGIISTVAGNGGRGFSGDNVQATQTQLSIPSAVAVDGAGNFYIADTGNNRIRKVDTHGVITTVAGIGTAGFSGDGNPAIQAQLNFPNSVAVDGSGNLFIVDTVNNRIRRVDTHGVITTVAGNGAQGFSGDNGQATQAALNTPVSVAVDGAGHLFIADFIRIREVDTTGVMTTLAGGFGGDGGQAILAGLGQPTGVTGNASGDFYIADATCNQIRKVDSHGVITTFAGNGIAGSSGDNGPAGQAELNSPIAVIMDGAGNLFIADTGNDRIRKVTPQGIISTVAGNGARGFSGDGGQATAESLNLPSGLSMDGLGNLFIADTGNNRIRKVDSHGVITTVAGTGVRGSSGDNGQAVAANLTLPSAVAVDGSGNFFIADYGNNRVRKVIANGVITTVAGTGTSGFSGDNGQAIQAQLAAPIGVALDGSENLFIAEFGNNRVRRVDTNGVITTVAGSGTPGFSGDNGPAAQAQLSSPYSVSVDNSENLLIADSANARIRAVIGIGQGPPPFLYGDLNGDGRVDAADLSRAIQIFLGSIAPTAPDLKAGDVRPKPGTQGHAFGDGRIGADDLNWLFRRVLGLETAP